MTKKKKSIGCSLIVKTYNRPDALECVLLSIIRQKQMPNEVIIADDGSTEETKQLIDKYAKDFPVPLLHCWQKDEGFRAATIRNKAVAMSHYEYIIMIDGDMVLHKCFVKDHLTFAEKERFLIGKRAVVSKSVFEGYIKSRKVLELSLFTSGIERKENAIRNLFLARIIMPVYSKMSHVKASCNASFWRDDYISINGFNEDFVGWGSEDSDFFARLLCNNVLCKYLRFAGCAWHLWNDYSTYSSTKSNKELFNREREINRICCINGINKYLINGKCTLPDQN